MALRFASWDDVVAFVLSLPAMRAKAFVSPDRPRAGWPRDRTGMVESSVQRERQVR